MTKPDIFNIQPLSLPDVAPVGRPWIKDHLKPSDRRANAWSFSIDQASPPLAAMVAQKVRTATERFNEALDNMLVLALEQGMDLAVSDWITDDINKTVRREFALVPAGAGSFELPFPPPVRIYNTSRGWPDGKDPRAAKAGKVP